MDISGLGITCDESGRSKVKIWVECRTREDCDDLIAWLGLAKQMMAKWEKIRRRESKQGHKAPVASNSPMPATGEADTASGPYVSEAVSQAGADRKPVRRAS